MSFMDSPLRSRIGTFLTRVLVPLWISAGALLKLSEASPKLLPQFSIIKPAVAMGWSEQLFLILAILIALEFFAIFVMVFLPRVAPFMAAWMLSCFCAILIHELASGATSCGCFGGAFSPPPWAMLSLDGALLLATLVCWPRFEAGTEWLPKKGLSAVIVGTILGFAACFMILKPWSVTAAPGPINPSGNKGSNGAQTAEVNTTPATPALPRAYVPKTDVWVGLPWAEVDLSRLTPDLPDAAMHGPAYVIYYSKTCDHCQLLLEQYFQVENVPTVLVAIPTTEGFSKNPLQMEYCKECVEHLDLPVGPDYIISTPIVVALMEGEVACAIEGEDPDNPTCLIYSR